MNPNRDESKGFCPVCGEWSDTWAAHLTTHNAAPLRQPANRAERRALKKLRVKGQAGR